MVTLNYIPKTKLQKFTGSSSNCKFTKLDCFLSNYVLQVDEKYFHAKQNTTNKRSLLPQLLSQYKQETKAISFSTVHGKHVHQQL